MAIWSTEKCLVCGREIQVLSDSPYKPKTCANLDTDCQRKYLHDPGRYDNDILRRLDAERKRAFKVEVSSDV